MVKWKQYRLHGLAISLAALAVGIWLLVNRWTPDEIENAQHFRQAMLEIRGAIAYANEQGGLIDPTGAEFLIGRYSAAAEQAGKVTDPVLDKMHYKLVKIWHEAFLPSTNLYLRALKDQDRDLARYAGLLQDDWVRWLQMNGQNLDIPDPLQTESP